MTAKTLSVLSVSGEKVLQVKVMLALFPRDFNAVCAAHVSLLYVREQSASLSHFTLRPPI